MNDATNDFSASEVVDSIMEHLPEYMRGGGPKAEPHRPASSELVLSMFHEEAKNVGFEPKDVAFTQGRMWNGIKLKPELVVDSFRQTIDPSTLSSLSEGIHEAVFYASRIAEGRAKCGMCQGSWPMLCPSCGPENCKPAETYGSGVFAKLESYGAQDVEITFGGIPLTGRASGEYLSVGHEPLITPAETRWHTSTPSEIFADAVDLLQSEQPRSILDICDAVHSIDGVESAELVSNDVDLTLTVVGGDWGDVRDAIDSVIPAGVTCKLHHSRVVPSESYDTAEA